MIDVEFGILKEIPISQKYGVIACIANVTITKSDGQREDDAALVLCRRSFGYGRTHLIMRQNVHAVLDTESLIGMAREVCIELYGSPMADIIHRFADLILDYTDDLIMHPPEDVLIEQKKKEKEIEKLGLVVNLNDQIILDAR